MHYRVASQARPLAHSMSIVRCLPVTDTRLYACYHASLSCTIDLQARARAKGSHG